MSGEIDGLGRLIVAMLCLDRIDCWVLQHETTDHACDWKEPGQAIRALLVKIWAGGCVRYTLDCLCLKRISHAISRLFLYEQSSC